MSERESTRNESMERAEQRVADELSAALAPLATPRLSPGFEVRLRARLAAERSPERQRLRRVMRWYWTFGLIATAATFAHALVAEGPGESGTHAFTALALLIALLELLPGRPSVSLVELVRRTLR